MNRILIYLSTIFLLLLSCNEKSTQVDESFYLSYSYSTEIDYIDIQIQNLKLTCTYVDKEKIKNRCAKWIKQSPCWTSEDFITLNLELSKKELVECKKVAEQNNIFDLNNYYGPPSGERCYAKTLIVKINNKEKQIIHCSSPKNETAPEAFNNVINKINELINQKTKK